MLFTGEYEHVIDAKLRLAIPAEIRSRLDPQRDGEAFYLSPGPNGFLWLWPERTFERMAAQLEQSLLQAEESMAFEELLFSQSTRMEIDKTGRVRLPQRMLEQAGLGETIIILGVKDHLELRDPEQWRQLRGEKLARPGEIMLRARRALTGQKPGGHKPGGKQESPEAGNG